MAYGVSNSREVSTAKSVSLAAATTRRVVASFGGWSLGGDTSAQLPFASDVGARTGPSSVTPCDDRSSRGTGSNTTIWRDVCDLYFTMVLNVASEMSFVSCSTPRIPSIRLPKSIRCSKRSSPVLRWTRRTETSPSGRLLVIVISCAYTSLTTDGRTASVARVSAPSAIFTLLVIAHFIVCSLPRPTVRVVCSVSPHDAASLAGPSPSVASTLKSELTPDSTVHELVARVSRSAENEWSMFSPVVLTNVVSNNTRSSSRLSAGALYSSVSGGLSNEKNFQSICRRYRHRM